MDKSGVSVERPWLGLASFTEETSRYFFGREAEITEIYDRIGENPLTVLYGQSGLGKTSLIGAGLLPRLRDGGFHPVLCRLRYEGASGSLLDQTRGILGQLTGLDFSPEKALWETFHEKRNSVGRPMGDMVVIFDQFEEIFTLGRSSDRMRGQAEEWLEQVSDLIQNRPPKALGARMERDPELAREYDFTAPPLKLMLSLREDYLSHLEEWKNTLPLLMQNRMALHLLSGRQAIEAVTGPADLANPPLLTQKVAAHIVRTAARVPEGTRLSEIRAVPPILSLLCEQLNLARIAAGHAEIDADLVSGKSADILQSFYEGCFENFSDVERPHVRALVEDEMVTVGGYRMPVAKENAVDFLRERGVAQPDHVFRSLIDRRLITSEERGITWLEITHDVLLPIIIESRKDRQAKLAEEEKEKALLVARREAAKRAKLKGLLAVTGLLLIAAIGAGMFGWGKKAEAERQTAYALEREKAATAAEEAANRSTLLLLKEQIRLSSFAGDWSQVHRLAYEADQLQADPYVRLMGERAAEWEDPARKKILGGHFGRMRAACSSPDGKWIFTAAEDLQLRKWDAKSGTLLSVSTPHTAAVLGMCMVGSDGDGWVLATCGEDRRVLLLNPETMETVHEFAGDHAYHPVKLAGVPGSSMLLSVDLSGKLLVFDWKRKILAGELANEAIMPLANLHVIDGSRVALVFRDGNLLVYDFIEKEVIYRMAQPKPDEVIARIVETSSISPDGSMLAVAWSDDGVEVFDLVNQAPLAAFRPHPASIRCMAFKRDEVHSTLGAATSLVIAFADGEVNEWDLANLSRNPDFQWGNVLGSHETVQAAKDFPALGAMALMLDSDRLLLVSTATGQLLSDSAVQDGFSGFLEVTSGRPALIYGFGERQELMVWTPPSVRSGVLDLAEPVSSVAHHQATGRFAVAALDGEVRVLGTDAAGVPVPEAVKVMRHCEAAEILYETAFSPDGGTLLTAGGQEVKIWDVESGALERTVSLSDPMFAKLLEEDALYHVAAGKFITGTSIAVAVRRTNPRESGLPTFGGEGGLAYVVDLEKGEVVHSATYFNPVSIQVSPDAKNLLISSASGGYGDPAIAIETVGSESKLLEIDASERSTVSCWWDDFSIFVGDRNGGVTRYQNGRKSWVNTEWSRPVEVIATGDATLMVGWHGGKVAGLSAEQGASVWAVQTPTSSISAIIPMADGAAVIGKGGLVSVWSPLRDLPLWIDSCGGSPLKWAGAAGGWLATIHSDGSIHRIRAEASGVVPAPFAKPEPVATVPPTADAGATDRLNRLIEPTFLKKCGNAELGINEYSFDPVRQQALRYARESGSIEILGIEAGHPVESLKVPENLRSLVWSGDFGSAFLRSEDGEIFHLDRVSKRTRSVGRHEGAVRNADACFGGTRCLTVSESDGMKLWDFSTGDLVSEFPKIEGVDFAGSNTFIHPSDGKLALISSDSGLSLIDLASGKVGWNITSHEGKKVTNCFLAGWLEDGSALGQFEFEGGVPLLLAVDFDGSNPRRTPFSDSLPEDFRARTTWVALRGIRQVGKTGDVFALFENSRSQYLIARLGEKFEVVSVSDSFEGDASTILKFEVLPDYGIVAVNDDLGSVRVFSIDGLRPLVRLRASARSSGEAAPDPGSNSWGRMFVDTSLGHLHAVLGDGKFSTFSLGKLAERTAGRPQVIRNATWELFRQGWIARTVEGEFEVSKADGTGDPVKLPKDGFRARPRYFDGRKGELLLEKRGVGGSSVWLRISAEGIQEEAAMALQASFVSPDESEVLFSAKLDGPGDEDDAQGLCLFRAGNPTEIRLLPGVGVASPVAAGWDGGTLTSVHRSGEAIVWELSSGKELRRCKLDIPPALFRDCLIDGGQIFTLASSGVLNRHDAATGGILGSGNHLGFEPLRFIPARSKGALLVLGLRGEISSIDPQDLSVNWTSPADPSVIGAVSLPGEAELLLAHSDGRLALISAEIGSRLAEVAGPFGAIHAIEADGSGKSIRLRLGQGDVAGIQMEEQK